MKRLALGGPLLVVALIAPMGASLGAGPEAGAIEYNRDVRPILAENCFACHGPDSASRKADLRLDQREAAVKAGAVAPGDLDASELIHRIGSDDHEEVMPPPSTKKTLTEAQKTTLKRWIEAGAEYQPHWSLIAPTRPSPPAVRNEGWIRNPIDRFVLARLEASGLTPAPEADRRTLARRLSLDLTGLPPSPALVEAFVRDQAPDAYERLVDRLMASAHWGEHRGRYWLDAARYADTHGIHFDNYREMWTYRDWVINAFNRNIPFDRFTIDQLAGDMLPGATLDQQIASGFNRCNITSNEGGLIDEEYLVLYARDRTETTSLVWLGMTAGCAVCHDHKFDPISQREFYSLAAFFNNTTQAAKDGNIKDTPPSIVVPRPEDRERWGTIQQEIATTRQKADARKPAARPDFDRWLPSASAVAIASLIPGDGLRLHAMLAEGGGKGLLMAVDGRPKSVEVASTAWSPGHLAEKALRSQAGVKVEVPEAGDFDTKQPFSYGAWVKLPKARALGAVLARMDDGHDYRGWDLWYEKGRIGTHIVHKWPGNAIKVLAKVLPKEGEWTHLFVSYDGSGKAAGVKIYINGLRQEQEVLADTLNGTIRTEVPLTLTQRHSSSPMVGLPIQDVRIYQGALPPEAVGRLVSTSRAAWLAEKAGRRTKAETDELYTWWLPSFDREYGTLAANLVALEQENASILGRATVAHVMNERNEDAMAYILFRGEYDKRRDKVTPDTPAALPPIPPDLPRNRLGLAQWLLRPEHPLTARVTVNRFWQELFGTGLVRTAGDFGVSGELPSHPELLDWLAVEFRERGWDVKTFFKTVVTSATYRQSALVTPEKLAKDPSNRHLSRGPRFRMDAEMVRDYALAASGLLNESLGGPSVKPYQPSGVWEAVAMIGSNTREYSRDVGEKLYRRSLYTFWKRAAPPASMDIFNAPSREVCTVRRERTNTPLQALVTLNDPQFIEAARHLAQRAMKEQAETTVEGRAEFMALRLLARPLRPEEGQVIQAAFADLLAYYQEHPEDATKLITVGESKPDPSLDPTALAAWTMTANELLNLDEVLSK